MRRVTQKQVMDANRFKMELVLLRQQIEDTNKEREYNEWKRQTDENIKKINSRIRATNLKGAIV